MKKRSLTNITVIALLLVLLTLVAVSGTYAKYTTTITGTGKAIVAKWAFDAKNGQTSLTTTADIDLAETATADSVITVDGVKKLAPGSKGTITLTLDNSGSDVAADLTVTRESKAGDLLTANQFTFAEPVIKIGDDVVTSVPAGATATATIDWEWAYTTTDNASDVNDTAVGTAATDNFETLVTLTIVGTQVANPVVNP